jgi:hypothetical protein
MASVAPEPPLVAAPDAVAAAPGPAQEPHCRNCGAPAPGNFCARCGQETSLALPTARQFLREAAGRYVAFDGRMWRTLFALVFRPGFLTNAYFAGRRRRYIRPARLFLVLSVAMFAMLRVAVDVPKLVADDLIKLDAPSVPDEIASDPDLKGGALVLPGFKLRLDDNANVVVDGEQGPLGTELKRRLDRFNAMSRQDRLDQLFLGMLRYGPYAMFVLLPAFALLLKGVYLGRAARYPKRPRRYAEHLVYAAHNHAFMFIVAALVAASPWPGVRGPLFLWALFYALRSQKAVYGGRWIGVFARAWVVTVAYLVLFVFVTAGLVLAAVILR